MVDMSGGELGVYCNVGELDMSEKRTTAFEIHKSGYRERRIRDGADGSKER